MAYFNWSSPGVSVAGASATPWNFASETNFRINFCLSKYNDFMRSKQYIDAFHELELLFEEISVWVTKFEKDKKNLDNKDKIFIETTEFKKCVEYETKIRETINSKITLQKNNQSTITFDFDLFNLVRNYGIYLRALMMENGLYSIEKNRVLPAMRT